MFDLKSNINNKILNLSTTMTYASDSINGIPADRENMKATEEGGNIEFHNTNLFDLNEDLYGNVVDEATGERIDNSRDAELGMLAARSLRGRTEDALGEVASSKADKTADEWMRANGFDWSE